MNVLFNDELIEGLAIRMARWLLRGVSCRLRLFYYQVIFISSLSHCLFWQYGLGYFGSSAFKTSTRNSLFQSFNVFQGFWNERRPFIDPSRVCSGTKQCARLCWNRGWMGALFWELALRMEWGAALERCQSLKWYRGGLIRTSPAVKALSCSCSSVLMMYRMCNGPVVCVFSHHLSVTRTHTPSDLTSLKG